MHGVRLVRTPPMKTAGSARSGLERSGSIQEERYGHGPPENTRRACHVPAGVGVTNAAAGTNRPSRPWRWCRPAGMADHAMSGPMDENMMKHMQLTPLRTPTHDD